MDLVRNGGGGVSVRVHFSCFCKTFNEKIMSKNWKRTIKQWWKKNHSPHLGGVGGGVLGQCGLSPSKCFLFVCFFNFPKLECFLRPFLKTRSHDKSAHTRVFRGMDHSLVSNDEISVSTYLFVSHT